MTKPSRRSPFAVAVLTSLLASAGLASCAPAPDPTDGPAFTLTILHNNDGESSLLPVSVGDVQYGGAALFASKVQAERDAANGAWDEGESHTRASVLLNSGDNFLAGTNFQASRQPGAPFYDAELVKELDYDALAIGNHEFDFGPAVFGEFAAAVQPDVGTTRFVSANLDFAGDPTLAPLIGNELVPSTVIGTGRTRVGVVGLTTPSLPSISSPGAVDVLDDLVTIAQAEIDALTARGIKHIVLQSHLQGLASELELTESLRDVDVVIGGGGDEVLADADTPLFPGDEDDIVGEYPQLATDADGVEVPVVTTPGNYRYVGVLEVTFDRNGDVTKIDTDDSGIKVVTGSGDQAVTPDAGIKAQIEEPVATFQANLASTVVAQSEVRLDCERTEVRGRESNCANLIVDAHLATGTQQAAVLGLDGPQLALMNGGGIRGEIDQQPGPFSLADTFRLQPFGNFVSLAENVPAEAVRQIIEEGAIRLPASGDGGFTHVSTGTELVIDPSFQARVADQNTGVQTVAGQRVRDLVLADGTVVVLNGVTQDVTVDLVQLNFSIAGGDAQPDLTAIPGVAVTRLPVSDQQSLSNFLQQGLSGLVTAAAYPVGGEGRLTIVPAP